MILPSLLEDKRYEWQKISQEEILSGLLCKSHKYKALGQCNDKLVMVFGKSHAGKTTFILSLMGVAENKLSELNRVLRADIPEGKSSTSTAIIYQKSDDNNFGWCERGINEVAEYNIEKCSKEEFVKKIQETRLAVESQKRDKEIVLYLYIPKSYFDNSICIKQPINILDVPGYETTNSEERYHTEAILKKYMSASVLNIVVRSIYDINDLQYFRAPNGDDYTKLTSGRYIIVTTRTYSQESIYKYFLQHQQDRTMLFEKMLCNECEAQFKRVFGSEIPRYFPIDIGESFYELINTKISNFLDREYLIAYRKRIFESIYECIYSKQSNSFISWVNEVIEDEKYYGGFEAVVIDEKIKKVKEDLEINERRLKKIKEYILRLESNLNAINDKVKELGDKRERLQIPKLKELIDKEVDSCRKEYFTEDYNWKNVSATNDVSKLFAEIFTEILKKKIEELSSEHDDIVSEMMRNSWLDKMNDVEIEIRENLNEAMNSHKFFKVLNPTNKEKIELGKNELHSIIPKLIEEFYKQIGQGYETRISQKHRNEINALTILLKENNREIEELEKKLKIWQSEQEQLEKQKMDIERRIEEDKASILEYSKVASKNYNCQRKEIITLMNSSNSKEEKLEYLILLGLMEKDYRKITME